MERPITMILMRRLALAALAASVVSACASGATPTTVPGGSTLPIGPPASLVQANLPRATDTDITEAELADLVAGNNEFAFDLFQALGGDANLFVSPYSVTAALTMTYAGARGDTANEIRNTLHFGLADERLHPARNELDMRITSIPAPQPDDERAPFTIRVANSLWGQAGYPFIDEYLELIAANYGAGIRLVDFIGAAEQARQEINSWVSEETEGRIEDLIPPDAVDSLTRLVLVNAIWFKANWAEPFNPDDTADGPFRLLDGTETVVPIMHGSFRVPCGGGAGYQALRIPYAGDAAMVVILPDDGRFEEVASGFDAAELDRLSQEWGDCQVELSLPRFEFRSEASLVETLQGLGIVKAFEDPFANGADFTGITEARELFVTDVVHQAFVKVDEQGTEAAAATAVIAGLASMPTPVTIDVDRPFVFLIQHGSTAEILFIGQVTDPS